MGGFGGAIKIGLGIVRRWMGAAIPRSAPPMIAARVAAEPRTGGAATPIGQRRSGVGRGRNRGRGAWRRRLWTRGIPEQALHPD